MLTDIGIVRTYPAECAKIMEQNFSAVYEAGSIDSMYPSRRHPKNLYDIFGIRFGFNSHKLKKNN